MDKWISLILYINLKIFYHRQLSIQNQRACMKMPFHIQAPKGLLPLQGNSFRKSEFYIQRTCFLTFRRIKSTFARAYTSKSSTKVQSPPPSLLDYASSIKSESLYLCNETFQSKSESKILSPTETRWISLATIVKHAQTWLWNCRQRVNSLSYKLMSKCVLRRM